MDENKLGLVVMAYVTVGFVVIVGGIAFGVWYLFF